MSDSASPSAAPNASHTRNSPRIVVLVATALFMESLDVTISTTALPQMAHMFNVFPADLVKAGLIDWDLGEFKVTYGTESLRNDVTVRSSQQGWRPMT
jgi:hypothetical protein